eukprot:4391702-Amphidinium_carterae.2
MQLANWYQAFPAHCELSLRLREIKAALDKDTSFGTELCHHFSRVRNSMGVLGAFGLASHPCLTARLDGEGRLREKDVAQALYHADVQTMFLPHEEITKSMVKRRRPKKAPQADRPIAAGALQFFAKAHLCQCLFQSLTKHTKRERVKAQGA